MIAGVGGSVPVTVKCRIGVDDSEDYAFLAQFCRQVAGAGCRTFVVHARKAWLRGLKPEAEPRAAAAAATSRSIA